METAVAQIGDGYAWGGSGPDAFDCSGLTAYAFARAGVALPHNSQGQAAMGRRWTATTSAPATSSSSAPPARARRTSASRPAATTVVSATNSGVMEHSTTDAYWGAHYVSARRIL